MFYKINIIKIKLIFLYCNINYVQENKPIWLNDYVNELRNPFLRVCTTAVNFIKFTCI